LFIRLINLALAIACTAASREAYIPHDDSKDVVIASELGKNEIIQPTWLGFTPDDKSVVTQLSYIGRPSRVVTAYNASTGQKLSSWNTVGPRTIRMNSNTMAFSKTDSRLVFLEKKSCSLRFLPKWEKTDDNVALPTPKELSSSDVSSIWIDKSDKTMFVLFIGHGSVIEMWKSDRPFTTFKQSFSGTYDNISAFAVSKSGAIFSVSSKEDSSGMYKTDIVELLSGKIIHSIQSNVEASAITVCDDDKLVAIGDLGGDLTLVDIISKKSIVIRLSDDRFAISSLDGAKGMLAYSIRGRNLKSDVGVLSLKSKEHVARVLHNNNDGSAIACFSHDAFRVASVDYHGNIRIVSVK
jgi:hypothetical protein